MPISTKYGSTGRPPGEYHLRHSSKKLANNLECLQPPFDIFSTGSNNNNNNNSNNCNNNGGIICDEGILVDSEAGAGAGAGSGAGAGAINVALMNRIEDSNRIESIQVQQHYIIFWLVPNATA
jgi:hypothetical protein